MSDALQLASGLELAWSHLESAFGADVLAAKPSMFSRHCLQASAADVQTMARFVAVMEQVVQHPNYRRAVGADLMRVPGSAATAAGVCMGYDFHLTPEGPKLIEINTNAGGLMLVAELLTAWGLEGAALRAATVQMFAEEWAAAQGTLARPRALQTLAIIDEAPATQYLAPEFDAFSALFEAAGMAAPVADPEELVWDANAGRLMLHGREVDFVYNRLTDFSLSEPASAALLAAWQAGAVVLSPHPLAHRLWADKTNLVKLADPTFRATLDLSTEDEAALECCLLPTSAVRAEDADALWAERRQLFFKPAAGFGSRAAYRGDKLTRRVFEEILAGDYVAQGFAAAPEISLPGIGPEGGAAMLKADVRNYTYRGRVLAVAARLYQGQTTNFRTPGGGFAPVLAAAT